MAEIKTCPYCGEEILSVAKKCKHCGEWLNDHVASNINSKKLKKFKNYLVEISVVVIGVAITLSASYWLGINNEKRDVTLHLNAIKLELEENIKELDNVIEWLKPSVKYTEYLQSDDRKSLNKDTIEKYYSDAYSVNIYTFKTNAFEMFKNSGVMRLIDDKELLLSIWEVYDCIGFVKETLNWFFQVKWDDMKKEIPLFIEDQKMIDAPMYFLYIIGMPGLILKPCENTLKKSKEMVEKMENAKR